MSLFHSANFFVLLPLITGVIPLSANLSHSSGSMSVNGKIRSSSEITTEHGQLIGSSVGNFTISHSGCITGSGGISGCGDAFIETNSGIGDVTGKIGSSSNSLPFSEMGTNTSLVSNGTVSISPTAWQSIEWSSTSGYYIESDFWDKTVVRNIYIGNKSETSSQQNQANKDNRIDSSSTIRLDFDEKKLLCSISSIQGPFLHFLYDENNSICGIVDESGTVLWNNSAPNHNGDLNIDENPDFQEPYQESHIDKIQLLLIETPLGVVHEIFYLRNSENVCRLCTRKL